MSCATYCKVLWLERKWYLAASNPPQPCFYSLHFTADMLIVVMMMIMVMIADSRTATLLVREYKLFYLNHLP